MKLATLILSFTIFCQSCSIGFSDILQLGELIAHAQFHKKEYGDDFFTFLSKHYGELKNEHYQKHKEESSQHEKLPFSEHQQMDMADFQVVLFKLFDFTTKNTPFISKTKTFFYNIFYQSIVQKGVFQPPQFS